MVMGTNKCCSKSLPQRSRMQFFILLTHVFGDGYMLWKSKSVMPFQFATSQFGIACPFLDIIAVFMKVAMLYFLLVNKLITSINGYWGRKIAAPLKDGM